MTDLASSDRLTEEQMAAVASNSLIKKRLEERIETAVLSETPPFPRTVLVEVSNICNHRCVFCAYPKMTRPRNVIDPGLFRDVMRQAYELGAREAGLYAGAEPLTCKHLDEYIAYLSDLGYDYIYISTNGTLADEARFKRLIDAGLHSIKFSVNGGDRETYAKIHGKDQFDKVINNIRFVNQYRRTIGRPLYLAVSFVEVPENAPSFAALERLVGPLVDEIVHFPAVNQNGQMLNLPVDPAIPDTCVLPFNQVHISREGYIRACCNDYQNLLATEDLNKVSLKDAWFGERFRELRRRHLEKDLKGALCHNCLTGCRDKVRPINPELGDWGTI